MGNFKLFSSCYNVATTPPLVAYELFLTPQVLQKTTRNQPVAFVLVYNVATTLFGNSVTTPFGKKSVAFELFYNVATTFFGDVATTFFGNVATTSLDNVATTLHDNFVAVS